MRRIVAMFLASGLLVALGCSQSYDKRMEKTLDTMIENKRFDDNLQAAVEGKLKEMNIFVRPPKLMAGAKEFSLFALQDGQFDHTETFTEAAESGAKRSLHVIARQKQAKKAAVKGAAPAEPPAPRGPFKTDLVNQLKSVFPDDEKLVDAKMTDDAHKPNTYKRLILTSGEDAGKKKVEIYLYNLEAYDVALIFQYDAADEKALSGKIDLCLKAFAVGPRATAKFNSKSGLEEDLSEGAAPGGGVAF
jgi:hypothetical protein